MAEIDIHNYKGKFKRALEHIEGAEISDHNRQLLFEWSDDPLTKEKLKKSRIIKLLYHVRLLRQSM
jgi:hypothetical protein